MLLYVYSPEGLGNAQRVHIGCEMVKIAAGKKDHRLAKKKAR